MQDGFFLRKKPFQGITFPLHQLENRYNRSQPRVRILRLKAQHVLVAHPIAQPVQLLVKAALRGKTQVLSAKHLRDILLHHLAGVSQSTTRSMRPSFKRNISFRQITVLSA